MSSSDKHLVAALCIAASALAAHAQTATNNCAYDPGNQYPVGTSCVLSAFNKPDAFTANLNASGCNAGNRDDAWGWFTATSNYVNLTFDPASNHRPIMHLYTGACGSLTQVGCVNSGGDGNNANLSTEVVEGQNYMVRIQRHNSDAAMNGSFCAWRPAFPANDEPCAAGTLTVNATCSTTAGDTRGATSSIAVGAPSCGNHQGGDVWYSFVAPANGDVTVRSIAGTLTNSAIALYSAAACAGTFTEITCSTNGNGAMGQISQTGLTPGATYYVRVWGESNTSGTFTICVVSLPNDEPCGATPLPANGSCTNTTSTNFLGTNSPGIPSPGCASYQGSDVWFSFVAPASGTITVETSNSGGLGDTGLGLYEASTCSTGYTLLECSDDATGLGFFSRVSRTGLTPGTTYYARVWGYGGASGSFNICAFVPTPPANDNPCASTLLPVNASCTNTASTNIGATSTSGIPAPGCGNYTGGDVWFRFVAPASGRTSIQTSSTGGLANTAIALYSAANCSTGIALVACDDDAIGLFSLIERTGLTPGATYFVRVWGVGGSAGTFNICAYEPAIAPPANDEPCGAIDMPLGTSCTLAARTNAGALHSPGIPSPGCGNYSGRDVWFRFTAPASGLATFRVTAGTLANPAMAVYHASSCSGPFTLISCDNSSGPGNTPFMSLTPLEIVPGETYYLRVWGNNGTTGTFNLCGFTAPATGNCIYVLRMWDSQGDGWANSRVTIQVGASPAVNYWNANADEDVAYIPVNVGQNVTLSYATGGSGNQNEIRYALQLINGPLYSDGPTPGTGPRWAGVANCQSAAPLPSDCVGSANICGAQQISANPSNTGLAQDLNHLTRGCLGTNERQGYWYRFSISASGLLGFTISPSNPADDYDFGIWGPYSSLACPPRETPVRCNYSGDPGPTGLSALGTNPTEGGSGNKWSSRLPVSVGENYYLYVSNYSQSGLAFDLSWQLESGASLDCTLLPVQLLSLTGAPVPTGIRLDWLTATESTSAFYAVERMDEAGAFQQIGQVAAVGNAATTTAYEFLDAQPMPGFNHYRLKMVDADGSSELSPVVSVANRYGGFVGLYPNPATDAISVVMDAMPEGEAILSVLDASGRLIKQHYAVVTEGQSRATMPLTGLERGHYMLSVAFGNDMPSHTGRFVVE
jgi:hypothetical protein